MKKILSGLRFTISKLFLYLILHTSIFILHTSSIFAASPIGIPIASRPANIAFAISLGDLIANTVQIMAIIGSLAALVFLVWGSLDWIMAGGDKEKLAGARKKIINTLTGLTLLALAYFIIGLFGDILGIDVFTLNDLPPLFQP